MRPLPSLPAWQSLAEHSEVLRDLQMRDLFAEDPQRFSRYSLRLDDLLLDYSKHRMTGRTLALLLQMARESGDE